MDAKAGQMHRARLSLLARLCVFASFAPLREISSGRLPDLELFLQTGV